MSILRAILLMVCALVLVSHATAAVPQTISYQGRLTTNGQPFADSEWLLSFSIYSTSSGGSALWTEQKEVTSKSGLFSTTLGDVTPFPAELFTTSPLYLGMTLAGNPEMTPRTPMVSVPYAMVAGSVAGGTTDCHACDTIFLNATGPEVFRASADTALKVVDTGSAARVGLASRIASSTSDTISAIRAISTNAGSGRSQAASFAASSTGAGVVHGVNVQATNNSPTYTSAGIVAQAENTGAGSARGGVFEAKLPGSGEHIGILAQSYGNSSANSYGLIGNSLHSGTGKSTGGQFLATGGSKLYGIACDAQGFTTDTSFGVYSEATNNGSGPAFGGYFQADSIGSGTKYGLYSTVLGGTSRSFALRAITHITSVDPSQGVYGNATNEGTGLAIGCNFGALSSSGSAYGGAFLGQSRGGLVYGVNSRAHGIEGSDTLFGVYAWTTGGYGDYTGPSFAGFFKNSVETGSSTLGLYSLVEEAAGTNASYGIYSRSQNYGSTTSYGGYFLADSTGTGISYGIRPVALSRGTAAAYGVNSAVANRGSGNVYAGFFDVLNYGTGSRYAVYASSPISGYAGYFNGDVRVTGDQTVLGAKSAAVEVAPEEYRLVYSQESPECWFEDFGEGRLVNGRVHIELDPGFLQTVTIDQQNPMKVFIQLNDPDCNGTAVVRGATGFDVVELMNGKGSATFSYRVVAKRKGFESVRLARMKGETPAQVARQAETESGALVADEAAMAQGIGDPRTNRSDRSNEFPQLEGSVR